MKVQPPAPQKKMPSELELYNLASEMEDHSYGSFDDCFEALKKFYGDIIKAKEFML
jgi:hypothetical protein